MDELAFETRSAETYTGQLEELLDRPELQEAVAYRPAPGVTAASFSAACPRPMRETVTGFPRYQNRIATLPAAEQATVKNLARVIIRSFRPGCQPIHTVRLLGHADKDLERERREPGFMLKISRERAAAVKEALVKLINNRAISARVRWQVYGAAANHMAVPNPRNERDRMRNRRVDLFVSPGRFPIVEIRRVAASLALRLSESQMRRLQAGGRVSLAGMSKADYMAALARARAMYPAAPRSAVIAPAVRGARAVQNPCQDCEGQCVLVRSKVPFFPLAACFCFTLIDLPFGGSPVPFIRMCRWFWWP
jgi:outer membrane protein OmpA-like peptidoglycan-associated protein